MIPSIGTRALLLFVTLALPCAAVTVNDVTRLNPIEVAEVVTPKSIDELVAAVKGHAGPISIGGGHFSQGGQTALENSLHIDMRSMDQIVRFEPKEKRITVQAGITWKKIQRRIDPENLSVRIMQTYSNFTVGGSLSVNVHGRYVGRGPLLGSVRALKIVLADGRVVEASREQEPELFFGVVGGYGGLGVIAEATLELDDNGNVERSFEVMPVEKYGDFFRAKVRDNAAAVFHNADIYPPAYETVRATTWSRTDKKATVSDRLIEMTENSFRNKFLISVVSDWPFGKLFRRRVLDPCLYWSAPVYPRNYEASYDVMELEPFSRERSTYVLQEYFVPVEKFGEFVPKMRAVFQKHDVNVINVSIRHAMKDPGSLLAWARGETFAFVVYYEQGVDDADRRKVGVWTRELVDAVLSAGGTYYLPYQLHATAPQFFAAYPKVVGYLALKRKLDPTYKFRNKLWDRYLPHADFDEAAFVPPPYAKGLPGYVARPEDQTYLTVPEWYILFSSDEYARLLEKRSPSEFPWFSSVGQFWRVVRTTRRSTVGIYPSNTGYTLMLGIIGLSFTGEYWVKGIYEGTLGRFTAWLATDGTGAFHSAEDAFMQKVQDEYVRFIRLKPWYEFSFAPHLGPLWSQTAAPGGSFFRRWERRFFYTGELLAKAAYGWVLHKAAGATYGPEDEWMRAVLRGDPEKFKALDARLKVDRVIGGGYFVGVLPRYEPFTELLGKLDGTGLAFQEIAGNERIAVTFRGPATARPIGADARVLRRWPLLTEPGTERRLVEVDVPRLAAVLADAKAAGLKLDHAFDY